MGCPPSDTPRRRRGERYRAVGPGPFAPQGRSRLVVSHTLSRILGTRLVDATDPVKNDQRPLGDPTGEKPENRGITIERSPCVKWNRPREVTGTAEFTEEMEMAENRSPWTFPMELAVAL